MCAFFFARHALCNSCIGETALADCTMSRIWTETPPNVSQILGSIVSPLLNTRSNDGPWNKNFFYPGCRYIICCAVIAHDHSHLRNWVWASDVDDTWGSVFSMTTACEYLHTLSPIKRFHHIHGASDVWVSNTVCRFYLPMRHGNDIAKRFRLGLTAVKMGNESWEMKLFEAIQSYPKL